MDRDDFMKRIDALSDSQTITLLQRITLGERASSIAADDRQAALEIGKGQSVTEPGDGAAARAALTLLADNDGMATKLAALIQQTRGQSFAIDPVTVTLLAGGLLFALQSHIHFVRKTDGTWSFEFKKTPTDKALILPLIKKLAALLGG